MDLTNINVIKDLFTNYGFNFKKSLGQNFIIDPRLCPKIAEQGGCAKDVCTLEIGAGVGVLTKELALRSKKVVCVEIDKGLKPILGETLADFSNIRVIFDDIMKIDLKRLFAENFGGEEITVCANLPYYITSPVIMRLLEERLPIRSITVMVQKEAAERICSHMGTRECGAITAAVNYFSVPKKLFSVSRGSFRPQPNVDSAVIRLDIRKENAFSVKNESLLFLIVKASFSQRRKQILNTLSQKLKIDKNSLARIMSECGINSQSRPEQLDMSDFIKLSDALDLVVK